MGREANFGNGVAEILRETMRKERKMMWRRERKKIEFWWCYWNSCPKCKLHNLEECPRGKRELWQPSWLNCRGEERENLIGTVAVKLPKLDKRKKKIVAMELPKIGRKRKGEKVYFYWKLEERTKHIINFCFPTYNHPKK